MSGSSFYFYFLFLLSLLTASIFLAFYKIPNNNIITILIAREPDTLTFLTSRQGISMQMQKALFRGLVEYNDKLKLYPELAEKIPTIDNGGVQILNNGTMQVKWTLKKGLKWSDGHPLTTKDILFTYNVLKHKDIYSAAIEKSEVEFIDRIQLIDDRNFIVIWKKLYYEYKTAHPILPEHILSPHLKNHPKDFDTISYHRNPIGNGPFILEEWVPGAYLLFRKNPHYHKQVQSKAIAFKILKDVNSLLIHLLTGEAHATTKVSPEQYHFVKKNYKNKVKTKNIKGMGWIHIDLNCDDEILQNKTMRKALFYAINRQVIVDAVSYGAFSVSNSWLPKKHYGYNKAEKNYAYNSDKANELLNEAGWKFNGSYRMKNGKKLKLEILTDSNDKNRVRFCNFIKEDLKKVGIDLHIHAYPTDALFSKFITKRNFQMALYAWFMVPRIDGSIYWHSKSIPGKGYGANFPGFSNMQIDRIQDELAQTLNIEKRLQLFKQHQEIWMEELPALALFETRSLSVYSKDLKNWKPTGSAIPETWNCEEWYLQPQQ